MSSGLDLIRKRGHYIQMGQTGDSVLIPFAQVSFKELTVSGGFASTPPSWVRAMRLLESRHVDLAPLVGQLYSLEQWGEAFEATRNGAGVKVMFVPNGPSTSALGGEAR